MKQIGSLEKIRKFSVKFENPLSNKLPQFHGQFATCGD
jgi:hypothetical protein